ncbi:MAG TPA: ABC transporter permease subunit [Pseudolabrys sp.]|nr:ABC transporter permease subunit [Pseudolabrys sp.]
MKRIGDFILLVLGIVIAWQALHAWTGDGALTSPFATAQKLGALVGTAEFWNNAEATARAFVFAVLISLLGGIGLGVILGLNRTSSIVSEPILIALYSLPKVTLYPLVLLCFGLGISAKVAFGSMHGLIPVTIFTMKAIMQIKPVYWRTAHVLRLTPSQMALTVALPAVLPEVLSGARLGFSLSLLGVLIGEMFASQRGLGFLIMNAMGLGDIATIMAVAVFLTVFAVAANALLLLLDRTVIR